MFPSSETIARAIVASARVLGADPALALTAPKSRGGRLRSCLVPAARALVEETGCNRRRLCAILNVEITALSKVHRQSAEAHAAAVAAISGVMPDPIAAPAPKPRHDHRPAIMAALARRKAAAAAAPAQVEPKATPVCQWPHGHPGAPDYRICGAPAAHPRPYCADHCVVAGLTPPPQLPQNTRCLVARPYQDEL